jgi:hypothetical protein
MNLYRVVLQDEYFNRARADVFVGAADIVEAVHKAEKQYAALNNGASAYATLVEHRGKLVL